MRNLAFRLLCLVAASGVVARAGCGAKQCAAGSRRGARPLAQAATSATATTTAAAQPATPLASTASSCSADGRATCTSLSLQINGRTGAYQGRAIGLIKHKQAPDGVLWTWQQCADMCLNYDGYRASNGLPGKDTAVCAYFLVSYACVHAKRPRPARSCYPYRRIHWEQPCATC